MSGYMYRVRTCTFLYVPYCTFLTLRMVTDPVHWEFVRREYAHKSMGYRFIKAELRRIYWQAWVQKDFYGLA